MNTLWVVWLFYVNIWCCGGGWVKLVGRVRVGFVMICKYCCFIFCLFFLLFCILCKKCECLFDYVFFAFNKRKLKKNVLGK